METFNHMNGFDRVKPESSSSNDPHSREKALHEKKDSQIPFTSKKEISQKGTTSSKDEDESSEETQKTEPKSIYNQPTPSKKTAPQPQTKNVASETSIKNNIQEKSKTPEDSDTQVKSKNLEESETQTKSKAAEENDAQTIAKNLEKSDAQSKSKVAEKTIYGAQYTGLGKIVHPEEKTSGPPQKELEKSPSPFSFGKIQSQKQPSLGSKESEQTSAGTKEVTAKSGQTKEHKKLDESVELTIVPVPPNAPVGVTAAVEAPIASHQIPQQDYDLFVKIVDQVYHSSEDNRTLVLLKDGGSIDVQKTPQGLVIKVEINNPTVLKQLNDPENPVLATLAQKGIKVASLQASNVGGFSQTESPRGDKPSYRRVEKTEEQDEA